MVSVQHDDHHMETSDEELDAALQSGQDSDDETAQQHSAPAKHTLYLRFHRRPKSAADVQQLDAAISAVRQPRQKNARHCLVDFANAADLEAARRRLAAIQVDGHKLIVSDATANNPQLVAAQAQVQLERREQRAVLNRLLGCIEQVAATHERRAVTHGVFVRDLPRDIRRSELEAVFPDALEVRIMVPEKTDQLAGASIELPSPADALKARKQRVTVRDVAYRPEFQRDGKHSVRLAKRLASRGVRAGPGRYFAARPVGQSSDGDGEVKSEEESDGGEDDEEEDAEVVNEIMKVYN